MSNDSNDNVQFQIYESIEDVAKRMVEFAKSKHPSSRIVSNAKVISMLSSSMGNGILVFGIAIFPIVVVGVDAEPVSDTIQDYTDHERMIICGCKGNCLHSHGPDCGSEIIYERLAANLFD